MNLLPGPRFKPFLADQVSLFIDSNLRDFNVLIHMPSLEPFASVDYILVYCEEKTDPIFIGPRFCVSEIQTRKEPHQVKSLSCWFLNAVLLVSVIHRSAESADIIVSVSNVSMPIQFVLGDYTEERCK